jgi:putative nucleotidyltransferase with HDIG domain
MRHTAKPIKASKKPLSAKRSKQKQQPYEDLTSLNTSRVLLDAVGKKQLAALCKNRLKLLETSGAIYEANGDYAAGFFTSGWCKLLNKASRKLCNTKDDKKALACGKWLCHESCWKASKKSMKTQKPVDATCPGAIRLYAVPIFAKGKCVGSINFSYRDPPKDEKTLRKLADLFKCNYEDLKKASATYKSRPLYVIEASKKQLKDYAMLIGLIVEHKQTLYKLSERNKELELPTNLSNILREHFSAPIDKLLQKIIKVVPLAFMDQANICAQFIYNKKTFKTKSFKKTKLSLKEEASLDGSKKIKIEIFSLATSPIKKGTVVFSDEEKKMIKFFIQLIAGIIKRKTAEKKSSENLQKLRKSLEDTISIISVATKKRDPYTSGHQQRVAQLAVAIAKKLNLADNIVEGIYFGALIHDIGKIYVPSEILTRPGELTIPEWAIIREHTSTGKDIVDNIDFVWPIKDIILHHHERLDGSGYPEKLKGKAISIECRIIGVADVIEAMMSHRPYRPALGIDAALDEIQKNKRKLYDPKVVDACVELFEEGFTFEK